jgi:hypothetical protein
MGVVMKGGTNAERGKNYISADPLAKFGLTQPVLNTETHGAIPNTVQFPPSKSTHPINAATPDFMPTGGAIPEGSTDVQEQGLPGGR